MGMTIEEAIHDTEVMKEYLEYRGEVRSEGLGVAIETMRKYQKIQEIAEKCNLKLLPKEGMSTFMKDVLEVLEDGRT